MVDVVKKYNVAVFGENYTLISDEPEERVISAAALVDNAMHDISKKNNIVPSGRIAVLVAIQLASELLSKRNELGNLNNATVKLLEKICHRTRD